jgi:hypothetical protein
LWLATFAMLFAMLAPSLSHALGWATGSTTWIEVCTAQGSRWVATSDADDVAPGAPAVMASGHLEHCPFCHLGANPLAPPPADICPLSRVPMREGLPERFFAATHAAHVWRAANTRAPPFLS